LCLNLSEATVRSHLTELDSRDTELADETSRTTSEFATVVEANRRSVLRKTLKCLVVTLFLELSSFLRILGY
jgi:hypothetical protein